MEHLIWVIKRLRNYYPYILLALFGVLLESVSTAGISLMVKKLVDEGMLLRSWEGLTFGTLLLLGLALAQQLGNFLVSYYTNAYAEKEAKELRRLVFEKLLKSSFLSVRGYSLGEYTTRVLSDLKLYRDLIGSSVVKLVRDPATVLLLFGVLLYRDWKLTLTLLALLPIIALSVEYFGRKKGKHLRRSQESLEKLINKLGDVFRGYESIKTLPAQKLLLGWFRDINENAYRAGLRMALYSSFNSTFNFSVGYLATALLLFYGGLKVLEGSLTFGELASYLTALTLIQMPLVETQKGIVEVKASLPVVQRLRQVLDLEEEMEKGVEFVGLKEGINVQRLSVSIDGRDILKGVSFSIRKGERVAVMGSTGSGKSTLLRVLCGFVPYEGQVYYDEKELREINLSTLRSKIAYLSQESFVLSGTVRENLLIANPNATEEEMWEALRLSACNFVESLDEVVDKESRMLSGGESQRLALARLFLKKPQVLLLDEATSALDAQTESLVLKNLFEKFPDTTFIVVAHRFSNILACERALVLKDGKLIFDGEPKRAIEVFLSEDLQVNAL
jgi:ATP-binding cassette subfamily C protein/subfamily B ATP-binding cassette protein MsbA